MSKPDDSLTLLRTMAEGSPLAIAVTEGASHVLRYVNPAFCRLHARPAAELLGRAFAEACPDADNGPVVILLNPNPGTGALEPAAGEDPASAGGEPPYWRYAARPILDLRGRPEGLELEIADLTKPALPHPYDALLTTQLRDVSQALLLSGLRAQEAADRAELAEQHVRELLEGLDAAVWEADAATWRFSFVSARATQLLGYPVQRWYTEPDFWPNILHPGDRELVLALCRERAREARNFDFECRAVTADGRTVWLQNFVRVVQEPGSEAPQFRGVTVDITVHKSAEQQLARQAFSDGLTSLPNRLLFMERLHHALQRRVRRGKEVAVLFVDLDGFKLVNDALGHAAGDELLREVAGRLQASLRDEDTLARFGGDEFAVLLEEETSIAGASRVAKRLLSRLLAPFLIQRREVVISASIGIAVSSKNVADPDALLRNADEALYRAKAAGKGQWVVFDQPMRAAAAERLQFEADLYQAQERGQLRVHYQPEVELQTGAIVGVEALLRWEHPQRGLLLPAEFLSVAEETRLIEPMGRWLRSEATRQVRLWNAGRRRALMLGVNLSAREFQHPELQAELRGLLAGPEPVHLRLELTETVLLEDVELAARRIGELRELGIEFALDDFGTGYSSLGYLRRLPVQVLKIDRSFIQELAVDETSRSIMQAITELGRALRMQLTAEGIETHAQCEAVHQTLCTRGQGFYFSRPVDARQMVQLLA